MTVKCFENGELSTNGTFNAWNLYISKCLFVGTYLFHHLFLIENWNTISVSIHIMNILSGKEKLIHLKIQNRFIENIRFLEELKPVYIELTWSTFFSCNISSYRHTAKFGLQCNYRHAWFFLLITRFKKKFFFQKADSLFLVMTCYQTVTCFVFITVPAHLSIYILYYKLII